MQAVEEEMLIYFSEYILLIVSNVIGRKKQEFHLDSPISHFGLDSMGVTKIVAIINQAFKVKISPVSLYGHKTIKEAANSLYQLYGSKINFEEITTDSIQLLCDKISMNGLEENNTLLHVDVSSNVENELLIKILQRAQQNPDAVVYNLIGKNTNQVTPITYADLLKNSLLITKTLQDIGSSSKVVLILDKSSQFIYSLFGTFFNGSIAIPVVLRRHFEKSHNIENLTEIINDTKSDIILTTRNTFAILEPILSKQMPAYPIKFIIYEDIHHHKNNDPLIQHNHLALIQYSTALSGRSKGVLYSHADVIKHLKRIEENYQLTKQSQCYSWVPVSHYMGLFYGILLPLYCNVSAYVDDETNFKFEPQRWLTIISTYRINITGGPDFAYSLCADLTTGSNFEKWDLSSWSTAYIGGQVINKKTSDIFISKFKNYGFNKQSICPSYGMAEAPLICTARIANDNSQSEILSSGKNINHLDIQIVDSQSKTICKEGELGEIWFSDKGDESYFKNIDYICSIYNERILNKPERSYARTGDVGYIKDGMIYVCGKIDDIKKNISHQALIKEPIAVVGMAGVFPQSDSCLEFWAHLEAGKDLISEIPENRWSWQDIYGNPDNENQITDIKWGGFINDIETFDAAFFNISSKEAQLMDPMQRKLIQIVWQAIEDAGYRMSDLSGKKVGVFVGIGTFDYLQLMLENNKFSHAYASTGIVHCMASNRISYLFDFKGPSESVDTACSSSLVSLHRAVGLIRNNECEMAIVCGANILLSSSVYVALSNAGMLSKTGKCKTFDDKADGYVRGEGIAAIVLKKLNDAKRDNDNIYGLIRGAAVNHGGHTSSLTAPNPFSQAEVIKAALNDAEINADTISYIESHGTATALGDPIEISGLTAAFTASSGLNKEMRQYCALGSVKTNIGHLEAAAGIASVIKVLLSMRHKKIPAHLHYSVSNKNIHFNETPFYIVKNTTAWKTNINEEGKAIPRRAGVSSFGFGGVNSHVILEEYQNNLKINKTQAVRNVFLFSAKTEAALQRTILNYSQFIQDNIESINLTNMAYTLQVGRESFEYRLAIVANDVNELLKKLINSLSDTKADNVFYAKAQAHSSATIKPRFETIENFAKQWILGENIDWNVLYEDKTVSRISLPVYPFEKTTHWITKTNNKTAFIKDAYTINWYEEPLVNDIQDENVEYILFCDRQGVSEKFSAILNEKSKIVHKIYYESIGEKNSGRHTIVPDNKQNYIDVLSNIVNESKKYYVLNFWPLDFGINLELNLNELSKEYQFVCQTALYQIQAFHYLKEKLKAHLWIICANVQAVQNSQINLTAAPLWGMARTLVLEQPTFFRAIIDIDLNETIIPDNLLREINSFSKESEVVYRKNVRYVPRMEPSEVKQSKGNNLKKEGEYLITGGLGSLGLLVAEWLSSLKVKKIYLLSRTNIANKKNRTVIDNIINRIQLNGTSVEIVECDVTNLQQMKFIAEEKFKANTLKGIFHLAGSYQESLLENVGFDAFRQEVAPKVEGTWILHHLFKEHRLDCFVMFSSGASVWGAATGGPYSAGNYFLDAYADYCKENHYSSLSISWGGLWRSSGLIPKNKENYFKSIGVKETFPEEGLQQLASMIDDARNKTIIAPINWPLFLEVMNAQREKSLFNKLNIQNARIDKNQIVNKWEEKLKSLSSHHEKYSVMIDELKKLLSETLSIPENTHLEEDIGFFNLGLDSLASIDFKNKINKALCVEISTTTLFDCNTLRLLANYLLRQYPATDDSNIEHINDIENETDLNQFDKNELLKFLEEELGNN